MRWTGRARAAFAHTGIPVEDADRPRRLPVFWTVAAFALVSGGLVALALGYLHGEADRSGRMLTQSLAHVIAEQTSRTLQAVDERLQLAASRLQSLEAERRLDEGSARSMLREQLRELPFVRAIWVLDREGRIAFDSDVGNVGLSLADREYFQVYRQQPATQFHIGPVIRSRSVGTWLMSVSRALRGPQGEFTGVIVAAIEPPYFEKVWRSIDLGEGGAVALLRRDGQLMIRSPPDEAAMGKNLSDQPLFSQWLASSPQGVFVGRSPLDGRTRVTAYRVLSPYSNLLVAVGSGYGEMMAPWTRFATLSGLFWLAAVLVALALSWMLHRQTRRSIHEEQRFRRLAQAMPQIVFITNSKGAVQFVNDRWAEATGRPVHEALGNGWAALIHPDDRAGSMEKMAQMMRTGVELQHEQRLRYADGVYRWRLLRAVPNRDEQGKVVSWYGTSTDVDELKQAQARLERQADQLGMAGRLAQLGSWAVDVPTQRITWSDEACAILDLPPGSTPSLESIFALFLPESRDRTVEAVQACMEHGTPFDVEVEMVTATGRPVWVRSIGQPVRDADGKVVRIEGAQQDITQHVRLMAEVQELNFGLEEKIAARTAELTAKEAALRLANQQLESFSYSVSHDLQSPLQRVAAFAQLLGGDLPAAPGSKARHYLARIQANVEQMTQLIDGLLALAHVSQIELIRGNVNLSALATEVLESLRSGDPARAVNWRVEPGLAAHADVRLMRSVLENLLGNAWKFTSRRPEADIVVGGTDIEGQYFVRDNGAGFDMAYAGKLFGTFQRLHGLDEFDGTGIGLATVARAVDRHGGRVWAEAAPGKGATFYFTIPPAAG